MVKDTHAMAALLAAGCVVAAALPGCREPAPEPAPEPPPAPERAPLEVTSLVSPTCQGALTRPPPSRTAPPGAPDVLLVTIDTWRSDRLGLYGGNPATDPWLQSVADDGVAFEQAIAPSPWTWPTLSSLASGLHPASHRAETADAPLCAEVETLAEVLGAAGWRTLMVGSNPYLDVHAASFFQGFEYACPSRFEGGPEPVQQALEAVAAVPADEPLFLWVHLFDPHCPYVPSEASVAALGRPAGGPPPADPGFAAAVQRSGQCHWLPRLAGDPAQAGSPAPSTDRRLYLDAYDGELRDVDDRLRELAEGLDRLGRWDDAWIALTGDHGEEFGEHGRVGHGFSVYAESTSVPLVLRAPATQEGRRRGDAGGPAAGRRVATAVSLVDVPPTLLDVAGVEVPGSWQGHSLAAALSGGEIPDRPVLAETWDGRHQRLLQAEGRRIIVPSSPDEAPPSAEDLDLVDRTWADLHRQSICPPGPKSELSPSAREELRSLGYTAP